MSAIFIHIRLVAVVLCFVIPDISATALNRASGKPVLEINQGFSAKDLSDIMRICPASENPPENDSQCKTISGTGNNPASEMKYYDLPVWLFITLHNNYKKQVFVLEHNLAITSRVTMLDLSDRDAKPKVAGDEVSVNLRDYHTALPAFRILLNENETKTFRISVHSDLVTTLNMKLYAEKEYLHETQLKDLVQAGFYGLMIGMIFYNLLLFLRLRLRMYLYYIFFVGSIMITYLGIYGHGFIFLWPDAFLFQKYGHDIAKFSASFFGIIFFRELLSVSKYSPKFNSIIRASLLILILSAVLTPGLSAIRIFYLSNIIAAGSLTLMLVMAILSILGKLPFNYYYLLAFIVMILGIAINLLMTADLIPVNLFSVHATQAGTAFEAIFLSIALGDRYAVIEKENFALQNLRMEEKKHIAQDIHDVIGTELQMRLIEINAEGESELSETLSRGLRSTHNKIREFLFLLQTDENLPEKLESNINELLNRLEHIKNFKITKDIKIVPGALGTTAAYHLERAIEEIISNIARHAKASKMRFYLRVEKNKGLLAVIDNGVGFDSKIQKKGIGMESLRYRAERLKGKLRIFSRIGFGTTVIINFRFSPLDQLTHLSKRELR